MRLHAVAGRLRALVARASVARASASERLVLALLAPHLCVAVWRWASAPLLPPER
jgi:hypothetical protein